MSGMELIPLLAAGASIGGTVMSAQAQGLAAQEQSQAALWEQRQHEIAEQQNRTAALQAEARRTEEMNSSLETIQALRAGRNTGAYSATGRAMLTSTIEDVMRDNAIERANFLSRADQNRIAAELSGRKSKTSLLAGQYAQVATYLTGASKAFSLATGPLANRSRSAAPVRASADPTRIASLY
jgi:hypothetical protein